MIPLAVPDLTGNERKYLNECIDTGFVSSAGEFVGRFEKMLAQINGVDSVVAVNSGTSALHMALLAAGVMRDDLVIVPDLTFIASANSVAYLGADPFFVDVSLDSWTIDVERLAEVLKSEFEQHKNEMIHKGSRRRLSAIMAVYTLGCPAQMQELNALAKKYNLPIVADAAAALGATYKGEQLAGLADFTTFSFNGNKIVTTGGGGAIMARDRQKLEFIRHVSKTARLGGEYIHDKIGYNYRMTNIEAAVGCAQLERLDKFLAAKRRIRAAYDRFTEERKDLQPFPNPKWAESACWFSGFFMPNYDSQEIKAVIQKLNERGIDSRPFWQPIHLQPAFLSAPRVESPVASRIWDKILTLPCSTNLTPDQQNYILSELRGLLRK